MVENAVQTGRTRKKLAILHWLPAEMYPPMSNIVRYFASSGEWRVSLFTVENHCGRPSFESPGVSVHRSPSPALVSGWRRIWAYASFHITALFRLLVSRPDAVLYIEPRSALPVYLLSFLRRRFPLFIHHHEYHEPREFLLPGMRLPRLFHRLERRRLFRRADWISHTNSERLNLFLRDNPMIEARQGRLLPNYPPLSWRSGGQSAWKNGRADTLGVVYVGSLSLRTTYIREFINWVRRQKPGSVKFDIFAYNTDAETKEFLLASECPAVSYHPEGVEYDELPALLRRYHTGVILYRAENLNYQFNASNKLFEYLACGLDVVFPSRMLGVKPYAGTKTAPRVIEADFESEDGLDVSLLSNRGDLCDAPPPPSAEDAIRELEQAVLAAVTRGTAAPG